MPVWWRGNGTQWSAGAALQPVASLPAIPVAAVAASPDDIDVFAAGDGNTPWWWHWNGTLDGARRAPRRRGHSGRADRGGVRRTGRLDVFAAGAGNHLWHWSKVGNGGGSSRTSAGTCPHDGVSAVSWGPNRIDVFAASRDPGNPLQHWWSNGGAFAGPEASAAALLAARSARSRTRANRLDVFGIAGEQADSRTGTWDGQRWSGPELRGDNLPAGDVSAVVRTPHRLDVFVAGAGNTLRQWPGGALENATTQPWRTGPTNQDDTMSRGTCGPTASTSS